MKKNTFQWLSGRHLYVTQRSKIYDLNKGTIAPIVNAGSNIAFDILQKTLVAKFVDPKLAAEIPTTPIEEGCNETNRNSFQKAFECIQGYMADGVASRVLFPLFARGLTIPNLSIRRQEDETAQN